MNARKRYIRALIKARINAYALACNLSDCEIMESDEIFNLMKQFRIPQHVRERIIRSCIKSLPYDDDAKEDLLFEYCLMSHDENRSMLIFEYEGIVELDCLKTENNVPTFS